MARFDIRVTGPNIDELWTDDTNRMAANCFREVLGHDTTEENLRFPVGTEIVCRDLRNGPDLLHYIIGYE